MVSRSRIFAGVTALVALAGPASRVGSDSARRAPGDTLRGDGRRDEFRLLRAPAERPPGRWRGRRRLGTILVGVGILLLAYSAAVVLWRDPATDLYTRWKQQQLSEDLERTFAQSAATFATPPQVLAEPDPRQRLAEEQTAVAAAANRLQRSIRPGDPLGRIQIPKLGLNNVMIFGTRWGPDLSRGPGMYPESSFPGVNRTTAIAGHRTTFGAPFRHIDDLRPGHEIVLRLPYGTFRYRVFKHQIVQNDDWRIIRDRGFDALVLSACHPLYSAEQRWVVFARLVVVEPVRGEPYRVTRRGEPVPLAA